MKNFLRTLGKCVKERRIVWRYHALQRMIKRDVRRIEVLEALRHPQLLSSYPHDRPFPSALVKGTAGAREIHIVAGVDADSETAYIITVWTEKEIKR